MAKPLKKTHKHKHKHFRNAAPPLIRTRNARSAGGGPSTSGLRFGGKDPSGLRTIKTFGGAMGAALACAYIARENWIPPKFFTGMVGAVGATLAVFSHTDTLQSVGNGIMSAAGAQLGLMTIDDHYRATVGAKPVLPVGKKISNIETLPAARSNPRTSAPGRGSRWRAPPAKSPRSGPTTTSSNRGDCSCLSVRLQARTKLPELTPLHGADRARESAAPTIASAPRS